MTTGFNASIEELGTSLAALVASLPEGRFKGFLGNVDNILDITLRYDTAIENGLSGFQAAIVAGTSTVLATAFAATTQAAFTAVLVDAAIQTPRFTPLLAGIYAEGTLQIAAAGSAVGDTSTRLTIELFKSINESTDEIWQEIREDLNAGVDLVTKFIYGDDVVVATETEFTFDASYILDTNSTTGSGGVGISLSGDAPLEFGGPSVPRSDFLVGTGGDDTLYSGQLNDLLVGGAGNDTLDGGGQAGDVAYGGDGNDLIRGVAQAYGGAGNDQITTQGDHTIADGGSGSDGIVALGDYSVVNGGGDGSPDSIAAGLHATVTTGSGSDSITTLAASNIDAGDGNNVVNVGVNAFGGYSPVYNGTESSSVHVGSGNDFVQVAYQKTSGGNATVTIDLGGGNNTGYLVAQADYNVTAGDGDDVVTIGEGNSTIDLGGGNNTFNDYDVSGNVSVSAGGGNDTYNLYFGASNISISDSGGNNSIYANQDRVNLSILGGNNSILIYPGGRESGGNSITTGNGDDRITFQYVLPNAGSANFIDAGNGNNTISGGAATSDFNVTAGSGNDVITTGSGNNFVSSGAGDDNISASVGNDTLFGGSGNDTIDASYGDDYVSGGAGNDSIIGSNGNDTLDGGTGDDTMVGGAGNDTYFVDSINDVIIDTQGINSVISSLDYTLTDAFSNISLSGQAIYATGNNQANMITGNDASNILSGAAGDDTQRWCRE